jgi:hypothetical protein
MYIYFCVLIKLCKDKLNIYRYPHKKPLYNTHMHKHLFNSIIFVIYISVILSYLIQVSLATQEESKKQS